MKKVRFSGSTDFHFGASAPSAGSGLSPRAQRFFANRKASKAAAKSKRIGSGKGGGS